MREFYYACDLLYTTAQIWFMLQVINGLFEPKVAGKRFYIGQAVIVGMEALHKCLDAILCKYLFSSIMMAEIVIVISLIAFFFYECRFIDAFCINAIGMIGLALADFFVQTCVYLVLDELGVQRDVLLSISFERGLYLLAWAAVMASVAVALRNWFARNRVEVLRYRKQGCAFLILLFICMVYFQRIYLEMASGQLLGHWFLFLLCNAVMVLAFGLNFVKSRAEKENQMKQMKLEMLEENYRALQAVYRERAILMHDMRNHLRVIGEMLEREEGEKAKAYIYEMTNVLKHGESIVYTNNEVLDLVLNMKFLEARKAQIEVCCQCDDMSDLALSFVEICALFSNLLDNAIEANEKCPNEAQRRIDIFCRRKEEVMTVAVSNPVRKEPARQGNGELMLATTKQDKALHGFGIPSIQNVLTCHSGHMKIEVKDGIFNVVLYLSAFVGKNV